MLNYYLYHRMDIVARSVTGRTYSLSVGEGVSVSALKEDLSELTGLSPDQLHLFPGEELQLLSKIRAGVMIHIKTSQGKMITVEVAPQFDTVENLKNKIEDKTGLMAKDRMLLVFEGTELCDDNTLASYGIDRESTLQLVPKGEATPAQQACDGTAGVNKKSGCCVII